MKILMVGCGGYAALHLEQLFSEKNTAHHQIAGIVDPFASSSRLYGEIRRRGIPIYDTIDDFYAHDWAPLALICTPIAMHLEHASVCFAHGSHVLLEKPIAATSAQSNLIIDAARKNGKQLGIGFQLCYDRSMLRLKRDYIESGKLGRPISMKALIMWQRGYAYYQRSGGWAGKLRLADGSPVYDSILTNATAHYLMNMLWLTSPGYRTLPACGVDARLGRAYDIETFDTAAARFVLPGGGTGIVIASHVAGDEHEQHPVMRYRFERGEVQIDPIGPFTQVMKILWNNGTLEDMGTVQTGTINKLNQMAEAIEKDEPVPCPGEAALASVLSNEMLFNAPDYDVHTFAGIEMEAERRWVPGLGALLRKCFEEGQLPGEGSLDPLSTL